MFEFFAQLFSADFMPHGHCMFWQPEVVWLHIISDSLIALSYYSIPVGLLYFVKKREDFAFHSVLIMFAVFILACGTNHIIDIWTLWTPVYRFEGLMKFVTAVASVGTAIAIWPLIPKALSLPSPSQLQEEIRERKIAEEMFRNFVELAPDATVVVNDQGIIKLVNLQAERLFDYDRKDMLGNPVTMLLPDWQEGVYPLFLKHNPADITPQPMGGEYTISGVRQNQEDFPVEISLSPIDGNHERLLSVAIRDISNRRKMEMALQSRTDQLLQSNQRLEQFANVVSHDLQRPLQEIGNYTEKLAHGFNDKAGNNADQYITYISENIRKMSQRVKDLLEFSLIDRTDAQFEPLETNKLVKEAIVLLEDTVNLKKVNFKVDSLPNIYGSSYLLKRLIQHLIMKSLQYKKHHKLTIKIGASESPEYWEFYLSDNGLGMPPEVVNNAFTIFNRLNTQNLLSGSEIGLAICKKVVEHHGGDIRITSVINKGTTFYFTIPKKITEQVEWDEILTEDQNK